MSGKNNKSTAPRFWSPLRIASSVIVFGLVAAFLVSSCNSNDTKPKSPPTVTATATGTAPTSNNPNFTPVPPLVLDAELKQANGSPIRLSDYSGKVVLVNLWATWCGPCRMETPELVKLHKEFQDRGVEMVALSTENPEASAESVRAFMKEFNVDYHVGWAPTDVALALMQGRTSIPQNFVITRDGHISARFIGYSPDVIVKMKQKLQEALN
jgi:thiol-disulfide isomerase/thioredoxin